MSVRSPHVDRREFLARLSALAAGSPLGGGPVWAANPSPQDLTAARMQAGVPSATAQSAAAYRAAHQVVDHPRVLDDPLALPILGRDGAASLQSIVDRQSRSMRAAIVMRSRYTEDRLAASVQRGLRQYVVLGAGLDTFAYRNQHEGLGLRVFEVDHPATQRWKQERLREAGIRVPASVVFVPVDFETESLAERLRAAGLRADRPTFVSMLGVVIYISKPALLATLYVVRACASGSEIVFSFAVPDAMLAPAQQASRARSIAAMAALGEPWVSFYEPLALAEELRALGFASVDLLSAGAANARYFFERPDRLRLGANTYMLTAAT